MVVSPESSESELLSYIKTIVRMLYVTGLRSFRKSLYSPELARTGTEENCVLRYPVTRHSVQHSGARGRRIITSSRPTFMAREFQASQASNTVYQQRKGSQRKMYTKGLYSFTFTNSKTCLSAKVFLLKWKRKYHRTKGNFIHLKICF